MEKMARVSFKNQGLRHIEPTDFEEVRGKGVSFEGPVTTTGLRMIVGGGLPTIEVNLPDGEYVAALEGRGHRENLPVFWEGRRYETCGPHPDTGGRGKVGVSSQWDLVIYRVP